MFNTAYVLSLLSALSSAVIVPSQTNVAIRFFLIPLLVAYVVYRVVLVIFPHINNLGDKINNYISTKLYGNINDSGYIQIFPPLFIVFMIFIVLLYNNKL